MCQLQDFVNIAVPIKSVKSSLGMCKMTKD